VITATLVIACLLSAGLGALAHAVIGLVRTSLAVKAADLAELRARLDGIAGKLTTAETAANTARQEMKLVREDIRLHELDLSTLAVRANVKRAA